MTKLIKKIKERKKTIILSITLTPYYTLSVIIIYGNNWKVNSNSVIKKYTNVEKNSLIDDLIEKEELLKIVHMIQYLKEPHQTIIIQRLFFRIRLL